MCEYPGRSHRRIRVDVLEKMYIWKQWKLPRTRVKNFMKLGMPKW